MDSSLNRSGKVLHVNALYAWALQAGERIATRLGGRTPVPASPTVARIDALFWPQPGADLGALVEGAPNGSVFPHVLAAEAYRQAATPNRSHYLSSVSYGRFTDECDVLANLLAVLGGMAGDRAGTILAQLDGAGVTDPYPSRTWPRTFSPGGPDRMLDPVADAAQDPQWRNAPGRYHNGAVWPFIGGFHAAALAVAGRMEVASRILDRVAAANRLGAGFPEWIQVEGGRPGGASDQTWNAGAYLYADALISGTTGSSA